MLGRHQKAYRRLMISEVETIIVGGGQAGLATDASARTGQAERSRRRRSGTRTGNGCSA